MEREILPVPKREICTECILKCQYCEISVPAMDIVDHLGVCGNRSEYCLICRKFYKVREAHGHIEGDFLDYEAETRFAVQYETTKCQTLAGRKCKGCTQRIVTCQYCKFPVPAIDLSEHQEVCRNRMEYCLLCSRNVGVRESHSHESIYDDGVLDDIAETRAKRRPRLFSWGRFLITIVITCNGILLGSLLLHDEEQSTAVITV